MTRGLYDATDETAISAQTRGYRFSISQYSYDSDYCYGVGDFEPYELFQPTDKKSIVAFYSRDDMPQQLMLLAVEYTIDVPASVEQDALEIVVCMTPKSDVHMENVDANPMEPQIREFPLKWAVQNCGAGIFR